MKGKIHCVCIALDLISSREYLSEKILIKIRDLLNEKYQHDLLTPFTIRHGDELIGQLNRFSNGYRVLADLFEVMKRLDKGIYVGIGFGSVETEELVDIHQVNGSAIRSALFARDHFLKNKLAETKMYNGKKGKKGVRYFCYSSEEKLPCDSINHMINYIHEKIDMRTDKQKELVNFFESSPNATYQAAGNHFNYEGPIKPNISKLLQRANYHLVKTAFLSVSSSRSSFLKQRSLESLFL